jgi:hypothetical protein
MNRLPPPAAVAAPGPFAKVAWAVGGVVVVVAGVVVSVAVLAVGFVVGAAVLGYLAWKTRALRRDVREALAASAPAGRVIEGEAVGVGDER